MPYRLAFILAFLFLSALGCDDSTSSGSGIYTDSLTLGTGKHGNELTGKTASFTGSPISIYWRVESSRAFGVSSVDLAVEQYVEGYGWKEVHNTRYGLTDYYGHVLVQSYFHAFGFGQFRATAHLTSDNHFIGTAGFTVKEPTAP